MNKNSLRLWGIGLLGAAINSAVGAVTMVIVEPQDFDPFGGGMVKLAKVIVLAIVGRRALPENAPHPCGRPAVMFLVCRCCRRVFGAEPPFPPYCRPCMALGD
jgi:hypothetical protein